MEKFGLVLCILTWVSVLVISYSYLKWPKIKNRLNAYNKEWAYNEGYTDVPPNKKYVPPYLTPKPGWYLKDPPKRNVVRKLAVTVNECSLTKVEVIESSVMKRISNDNGEWWHRCNTCGYEDARNAEFVCEGMYCPKCKESEYNKAYWKTAYGMSTGAQLHLPSFDRNLTHV